MSLPVIIFVAYEIYTSGRLRVCTESIWKALYFASRRLPWNFRRGNKRKSCFLCTILSTALLQKCGRWWKATFWNPLALLEFSSMSTSFHAFVTLIKILHTCDSRHTEQQLQNIIRHLLSSVSRCSGFLPSSRILSDSRCLINWALNR